MSSEPDASPFKAKRVNVLIGCAVVGVLILYLVWRSGVFSSPQKPAAAAPPELNHKVLIQDENFHVYQGMAYADAGLLDQAVFEEMEAYRINPRSFPALNNVGFYLYKAGRYADSAAALEQALKLQPTSELARNNLRNTYAMAIERANTPAEKENLQQRKEKLEAGTLVDFLNQANQAGATPKK